MRVHYRLIDASPARLSQLERIADRRSGNEDRGPRAAGRGSWNAARASRIMACGIITGMPRLIAQPSVIAAAGTKPKVIEEYIGRVNSGHAQVSVARMVSPQGWEEPGQRPDFEELTIVLKGLLRLEHADGALDVRAGQAVVTAPGEWIRYSSPEPGGAEYVAVCLPAFSPDTVHRDA